MEGADHSHTDTDIVMDMENTILSHTKITLLLSSSYIGKKVNSKEQYAK